MMLSKEEQQLILDFYFRCGSDEDIIRGRDLIAANPEAARLYGGLEETLTELDSIKYEPCPENLADLTIARLKVAASASRAGQAESTGQSHLERLLEAERQKAAALTGASSGIKIQSGPRLLRNFFEFAATAAAIILISGILFPTFSYMRQQSRLTACTANMQSVGQAINQFLSDNGKNLAGVELSAGSPWWKIGDQSQQSQSNTRFAWQMVKQDYVKPNDFVCAGHRGGCPVTPEQLLSQLQDFSSRNNISYSFIIISDKMPPLQGGSRKIVMGDMNPVFRSIPMYGNSAYEKMKEFEKVLLDQQLKQMSSTNHYGKGQNVMYSDGSAEFIKDRVVNGDDIFTVRGVDSYTGTESPADENDIFLVP
jgi:type II secretory pathway pseudopilin PulG